jgi:4-hydroxy-tetrahydrodipicolinate synthase
VVPLVTPFVDGELDIDLFEESIERQVNAGSDGIVVTGTTGEPTSLTVTERALLFCRAVKVAAGRIAVVAATGSSNHEETLSLTGEAEKLGTDAVLVVCPAFVRPSQNGLVAHFAAVTRCTDLPLLIYNIPGRAGVGVTADTVFRIVEAAPNVKGLKHASNDLDLVTELLLGLGDDFRLFCGVESYSYPFLAVGGCGLMSAVGNVVPQAVKRLCAAVDAGDHRMALALHRALFGLNQAVFYDTNPGPLKAMMAERGLAPDEVRLPLAPLIPAVRARVVAALQSAEAELESISPRSANRSSATA